MKLKKNIALSDTGFVFDPGTGESFSLNNTGSDIVALLKKESSIEEIKKFLSEKYEASEYEVEKEIHDFFTILRQYNLIEEDE